MISISDICTGGIGTLAEVLMPQEGLSRENWISYVCKCDKREGRALYISVAEDGFGSKSPLGIVALRIIFNFRRFIPDTPAVFGPTKEEKLQY